MAESAYPYQTTSRRESWFDNWGHVSWQAIFAGVAIALTVQILLSMLGTGIGMSTIDLQQADGTPSAQAFSLGAGLWWAVSFFLSLAIGGVVAGHFAGSLNRLDGMLHGLVTWAVATLLGVYLVTSAVGSVVSGAGSLAGAAFKTVGAGAAAAVPAIAAKGSEQLSQQMDASSISWDSIKSQVQATLLKKPVNGQAPQNDALTSVQNYFSKGEEANPEDRQAVVAIIAQQANISQQEADNRLTQLEGQYKAAADKLKQKAEQAKAEAKIAADKTAKVIAQVSLWGFIAFVLSAIAAALGGIAGTNCRASRTNPALANEQVL